MTILTHPIIGDKQFEDNHAKRLLEMKNNGGWELKENAATKRNKGNTKKSITETND